MMNKFTLSYHFMSINNVKNHLDLFLYIGSNVPLIHYFTSKSNIKIKNQIKFTLGEPHRQIYLNYQGKITNNRGRVRVLMKGMYIVPDWIKNSVDDKNISNFFLKKRISCVFTKNTLEID